MPRLPWVRLPNDLGNALFQCYDPEDHAKSIFGRPQFGMRLQKPNFATSCYLDGNRWHHQTDAYGQRNPETWGTVDVALIGDGAIYGQGVEPDQAAAHLLRGLLRQRVANLGQPFASPVEYLTILRNFAVPLHPKTVIVVVSANDREDLIRFDPSRLQRFVTTGDGLEMAVLPREVLLAADDQEGERSLGTRILDNCLTCRTLRHYGLGARVATFADFAEGTAWGASPPALLPPPELEATGKAGSQEERVSLALAYLEAAVRAMAAAAKDAGARLVLVYLPDPPDGAGRVDEQFLRDVRRIGSELHLDFCDTSPDLLAMDEYRHLKADPYGEGLLRAEGQRKLAETLALFLRNRAAFERSRSR
jgi:hypothetical protein